MCLAVSYVERRFDGRKTSFRQAIFIYFWLNFLEDISLFVGPLIWLFWTSGDVSSEFQSQSGQPYSHLAEAYVLHIPWNSPLVQHLPTSW